MYYGQPVNTKYLKKVAVNCDVTMNNTTPVALTYPGMKDIQRIELWTKWRTILPVVRRKESLFLVDPGPAMAQQLLDKQVVRLSCRKEAPTSLVT